MSKNGHARIDSDGHGGPQFKRLGRFDVEVSRDGQHLYSVTQPDGEQPFLLVANRMQVTSAAQALSQAAYLMARRSGTAVDVVVDQNWFLQPDMKRSIHRYDPFTRMFLKTYRFADRLPLPMTCRLEDYLLETARCDRLCGIVR